MLFKKRLTVESLENRAMLAGDGIGPVADVCTNAPDNPNCAVIGDADGDGFFTSSDITAVFAAGKYESGLCATWEEGDWNRDGVADSSDFILAFSQGYYEMPELTFETFIPGLPGETCPPGRDR